MQRKGPGKPHDADSCCFEDRAIKARVEPSSQMSLGFKDGREFDVIIPFELAQSHFPQTQGTKDRGSGTPPTPEAVCYSLLLTVKRLCKGIHKEMT